MALSAATHLDGETRRTADTYQAGDLTEEGLSDYFATARQAAEMMALNSQRAADQIHSFKQVAASTVQVKIEPGFPLSKLLGDGRLVMGNPDFVPLGIYAKGALEKLGVWRDVQGRLIPTTTVMETVNFIERGEAPLGIGFASDVVGSAKVKAVALFPEDSHAPIAYPVAMIKGNTTPAAKAFYDFLRSDEAACIFTKYGFKVLR